MNLRPECPVPLDDQLLNAFAYAINWRDSHDMKAEQLLNESSAGGQRCDCEEDDWDADEDPDHVCAENLLGAVQCLKQAQIRMGLAQAAANAALAAATLLASRKA